MPARVGWLVGIVNMSAFWNRFQNSVWYSNEEATLLSSQSCGSEAAFSIAASVHQTDRCELISDMKELYLSYKIPFQLCATVLYRIRTCEKKKWAFSAKS